MSAGTTISSRAAPRCRKCGRYRKGHPMSGCPEDQPNVDGAFQHTFANPENNNLNANSAPLPSASASASHARRSIRTGHTVSRPRGIRFVSPRSLAANSTRRGPQQPPSVTPTVEELVGFLLGLDIPVDPTRVRFALSMLEELEGAGDAQEIGQQARLAFQCPPRSHEKIAYKTKGSAWCVALTYLLVAIAGSGSTIIFLIALG